MAPTRCQLKMGARARDLEEDAVLTIVAVEPADFSQATPVSVEPDDLIDSIRVARDPQFHSGLIMTISEYGRPS